MDTRQRMRVISARREADRVEVRTSGARYLCHCEGEPGRIECWQELGACRRLAVVELDVGLGDLAVEAADEERCILHQLRGMGYRSLTAVIGRDSLLELSSLRPLTVSVQVSGPEAGSAFPSHVAEKDGCFLLADGEGGVGLYPCAAGRSLGVAPRLGAASVETARAADGGVRVRYRLEAGARLLISVFPPRPFEERQYREDGILHHGSIGPWVVPPLPDDAYLERARPHASVLVLHEGLWQGQTTRPGGTIRTPEDIYDEAAFTTCTFTPIDEAGLRHTIARAHDLGMRVLPYMSPYYAFGSAARPAEFLPALERVLGEYGFDGVYYDGVSTDLLDEREWLRATRALLGERLLYLHSTSGALGSREITCPFVDTWADYVLRAEHATQLTGEYLRHVVSGCGTSNAVGVLCYYDLPLDLMRRLIPTCLEHRVRFYLGSPPTQREELLLAEYFPRFAVETGGA